MKLIHSNYHYKLEKTINTRLATGEKTPAVEESFSGTRHMLGVVVLQWECE